MDEYTAKALKLLRWNHVTAADIARYTKTDVIKARRILDTLSFDHPVYEVKRGVYGLLPRESGRGKPAGIIARRRHPAER
ncbi:MAG: hypothetical protein LBQ14_07870 [Treponema sp.]|jgi:hypothetical protein|nr:hypothetical protein [Treponema sp.]